jgi:hypothetical protein
VKKRKLKLASEKNHKMELRPNKAEIEFLDLAYNRFYDIFEEMKTDEFWEKEDWYRFSKTKEGFSIYSELLNYEPLKWVIEHIKKARPPMEAEIGSELFKFIRNVVIHFPFFNAWNDVWVKSSIINWFRESQSIDKFLKKYSGKETVKYRFWEADKEQMTYLSIKFPPEYNNDDKIYLKDFLTEKEGVKFSFILMKQILDTQIEEAKNT